MTHLRRKLFVIATVLIGVLIAGAAYATPIRITNNLGQLIGATDVDVLGALYDVEFVDGTCVELFRGCNDAFDFSRFGRFRRGVRRPRRYSTKYL